MPEYTKEQLENILDDKCQQLEQRMVLLPAMEEKSRCLNRILSVKKLLDADEARNRLLTERDFMKKEEIQYREAGNLGMSAYVQNQMGYRMGPIHEAEAACQDLLEKSGFANIMEAREWISKQEEEQTLKQEISDFQSEYQTLLKECNELDRRLSAME